MTHVLDNPVWDALTGPQAALGERNALAARYRPSISPMAALKDPTEAALDALATLMFERAPRAGGDDLAIVLTSAPRLPDIPALRCARTVALHQMWCSEPCTPMPVDAVALGDADVPDMLALVRLTEPGPFAPRTIEFGGYFGVREGSSGRLLAMTGERVRPPGWSEVSGVCTHPDGRGKGYAYALVAKVTNAIIARGERAFLHVAVGSPSELGAMRVYERAGFTERCAMHIHAFVRANRGR